jgi:hypothetical protein
VNTLKHWRALIVLGTEVTAVQAVIPLYALVMISSTGASDATGATR